ncbi:synaptogenesis protein syg-2-like [Polypterus senegalus]|uniref:synaptogenesis protein syg-2-like n=1 Tax=Polypterus senegalus TaxID=55291 RepID=UPI001964447B|nr:synaptogenesis protein syg-2-like [Polypterus senegalus]XP_039598562.1 synaptogenesis protein syg-2-like [Polypterus senegalus]
MAKAGILALTVTVLLLCRFSSGKTDLEIVQSPPFVTAVEKDPVVLQCTIKHHLSGFQMRWYRETAKSKGHFYSATPPRHRLNDGRAQLVNEDGNMVWSLKITDLKEEDSGVYYCQMYEMMETGKEELRSSGTGTHLIVEAPLTILQYPSPAVMEKNSITLTCLMGNEAPEGTVRWFRETGQGHVHFFSDKPPEYKLNDGRASWVHSGVTGDNSITVTDLSVDDSGVYYCEKYRKLNNGKEELLASGPGTKVTVEAEIVQSPASVTVNVGDSVTLLCAISGSQGFVRWMKETKQGSVRVDLAKLGHGEENSDRVHWHNNNEKWEASITIDTVKTEDSGVYYCQKYTIINPGKEQKVSSGAGTELIVKEPPALQVFQPKTQILCKKGTSVVLNCFTSPLDSSSIVTWYRNTANGEKAFISSKVPGEDDETDPRINFTKQQQDKVDWSITIEKLKVKDSGEYYCEVSDTRQTITSVAVKLSVTGELLEIRVHSQRGFQIRAGLSNK